MKNTTIKDIAKIANVSYATVSRALSGSPGVSDSTREKIASICEDLGYTPNYAARSMVAKNTKIIGLIVTDIANPYISEMSFNIEQIARESDYHIMLCNSVNNVKLEEQMFKLLIGRQVDGILIFPAHSQSQVVLEKYLDKIPTVFVSENLGDFPACYVSVDNIHGSKIGMEYLYSLGHRRILYFGSRKQRIAHKLRAEGYSEICEKYNLKPQFWNSPYATDSIQNGYIMAKEMFDAKLDFSAVFASTDSNALGIMQAAEEKGIRVPEDISLLGFDNIIYAGLPKIMLSTIEQPLKQMAKDAVEILINKIGDPDFGYSHKILPPKLIVRNSCIAVP